MGFLDANNGPFLEKVDLILGSKGETTAYDRSVLNKVITSRLLCQFFFFCGLIRRRGKLARILINGFNRSRTVRNVSRMEEQNEVCSYLKSFGLEFVTLISRISVNTSQMSKNVFFTHFSN